MLLAALGDRFVERHPWSDRWWQDRFRRYLMDIMGAGVEVGRYDAEPARDESVATAESRD